ncbi:MAG: TldD/PmbA family protein [Candidatus Cloacimonadaceae bacterium]|nr:TldD/PmbA family protein [Candidatus Cloacimonadaceae bacterium]
MRTLALDRLLPPGAGYTELKVQENRSTNLGFLNGSLIQNNVSSGAGIMCRTFKNGVWGLASSPLIHDEEMRKTIKKALSNAALLDAKVGKPPIMLPQRSANGEYLFFTTKARASVAQKIEYLKNLDAYIAEKYPGLASRGVYFGQLDMQKQILVSDGGGFHGMTPRAIIVIQMTLDHNGEPLQHYDLAGGFGEWEDHFEDPAEHYDLIDRIYEQLLEKRDAVFAHPGTFDCVLDSRLAGILSHEAIGHTTEADLVLSGSIAGEYMDQMVASPIVTLLDVANTWDEQLCPVPVFIDDEGTEAMDCTVIERGILKSYMHNKESAQKMGLPLTGNARAYAYSDEPLIRMRNTMIVPGKDKLADMIASIEDGYYLILPSNGQADSTSEFMFGVTRGYEIKNGVLAKPIKETTISGIAFDMLKTITMISDDMDWTCAGMCGKKQQIPVGMGGPAIKCKMNIGGRS